MPQAEGMNFAQWLRRVFGATHRVEPELVPNVQPVVLLGDHRLHMSPLFPPMGLVGIQQDGVIGNLSAMEIQANTPGGLLIHYGEMFQAASGGGPRFKWQVGAPLESASIAVTVISVDPNRPVSARAFRRLGGASVAGVNWPVHVGGWQSAAATAMPPYRSFKNVWIPAGQALTIESYGTNQSLHVGFLFSEFLQMQAQT